MKIGILAAGGDIILLPEIPYSDEKVIDCIKARYAHKKPYSIVVVIDQEDQILRHSRFIGTSFGD